MKSYQAVVFDFDYTLANSEPGIVKCFRLVLEELNAPKVSDRAIKQTIGLTLEDAFAALIGEKDPSVLKALRRRYVTFADVHMVANTTLYRGVKEMLFALKSAGKKVGILSTKYAYRIRHTIQDEGLQVDAVVGGEAVSRAKPDPEGMIKMAEALGVSPHEILYVGDSLVDAKTAASSGTDFVAVTQGTTEAWEFMRYPFKAVLDNVAEIADLIKFDL